MGSSRVEAADGTVAGGVPCSQERGDRNSGSAGSAFMASSSVRGYWASRPKCRTTNSKSGSKPSGQFNRLGGGTEGQGTRIVKFRQWSGDERTVSVGDIQAVVVVRKDGVREPGVSVRVCQHTEIWRSGELR